MVVSDGFPSPQSQENSLYLLASHGLSSSPLLLSSPCDILVLAVKALGEAKDRYCNVGGKKYLFMPNISRIFKLRIFKILKILFVSESLVSLIVYLFTCGKIFS